MKTPRRSAEFSAHFISVLIVSRIGQAARCVSSLPLEVEWPSGRLRRTNGRISAVLSKTSSGTGRPRSINNPDMAAKGDAAHTAMSPKVSPSNVIRESCKVNGDERLKIGLISNVAKSTYRPTSTQRTTRKELELDTLIVFILITSIGKKYKEIQVMARFMATKTVTPS